MTSTRSPMHPLLATACLVVILAGLKAAEKFFVPVLFALFVAVLFLPVLSWLRAKRVPNALALLLTLVLVAAILLGLAYVMVLSVERVADLVPRYQAQFEDLQATLGPAAARLGFDVSRESLAKKLDPERLIPLATRALSGVTALAWFLLLVLLLVVFTFVESRVFPHKLRAALEEARPGEAVSDDTPPDEAERVVERFARITDDIQRYLVIKTAVSVAMGVVVGVWLWAVGVDLPLLWGLLAFLLNYIPNIGSVAAAVPPAVLALVQLGTGGAVAVLAGFLLANLVIGNIVEPNLMGRSLGLSPLVVLLSLVFWGWLWGMIGTLLAVPLAMILKILVENSPNLSWIARLMDARPHPEPAPKEP